MKNFVVTDTENGMRLLRLVQLLTFNMPKSILYKSFRKGRIKIDGKKHSENYRVKTGENVSLYINDEFFITQDIVQNINPCYDFHTIYIDDNIAIIEKPSGVLCHSDATGDANLLDGFISKFGSGNFKPCLINRIDRGTEGLVIIARTHNAAEKASLLMRNKKIKKRYLAVTDGSVDSLVTTGYFRENKITIAIKGKGMTTEFKTLGSKNGYYLIEAVLHTGKTHQIRAQLASLGVHIIGDRKYLTKNNMNNISNQLLCAYELSFDDNLTDELIGLSGKTFTAQFSETAKFYENL